MINATMTKAVKAVNHIFKYETDEENYGSREYWSFLGKSGKGDCEDYSLTVLREVEGSLPKFWWALLTRKAKLYHCSVKSGGGHCILNYKGHWVDNNYRRWVRKDDMERLYDLKYPYPVVMVLAKFMLSGLCWLKNKLVN